jgi:hypothetical protein
MKESDKPVDIIELCDVIEDLATAIAEISDDGYVDARELKKSVLEILSDRLPPRLMPVLERHCHDAAYQIGNLCRINRELAEVKAEIRRKQLRGKQSDD